MACLKGHSHFVMSVAYSPDGATLASCSWDKTVKLWDMATWTERATLKGHTDKVRFVAYSPDGRSLASIGSGADQTIRLWDMPTASVIDKGKQGTPPAKDTNEVQKQADGPKTKTETKREKRSDFLYLDGVEAVDLEKGTVTGKELLPGFLGIQFGDKWEIKVKPTTKITIDGENAPLADLRPLIKAGYPQFFVEWETETVVDQSNPQAAKKGSAIRIDTRRREGEVPIKSINVSKNTITVLSNILASDGSHEIDEREVTKDVEVEINGRPASFADLKPNMQIRLSTTLHKTSKLFGRYLVVSIEASGQKVYGVIRAVDADKKTISVFLPYSQMTAQHVPVAAYAKVVIDDMEGRLSDLKTGMEVNLQMSALLDESLVVGITAVKNEEKK